MYIDFEQALNIRAQVAGIIQKEFEGIDDNTGMPLQALASSIVRQMHEYLGVALIRDANYKAGDELPPVNCVANLKIDGDAPKFSGHDEEEAPIGIDEVFTGKDVRVSNKYGELRVAKFRIVQPEDGRAYISFSCLTNPEQLIRGTSLSVKLRNSSLLTAKISETDMQIDRRDDLLETEVTALITVWGR